MHSDISNHFSQQSKYQRPLVLVVDNDHDNLLLAGYIVESMGFNFAVTNKSEDCLFLVEKLIPDLILLNIVMPKISGLEIAHILKQDQKFSTIPLIAVTGLTKLEDRNKILQAGFDDYLAKPYLIEDLETKLQSLVKSPGV